MSDKQFKELASLPDVVRKGEFGAGQQLPEAYAMARVAPDSGRLDGEKLGAVCSKAGPRISPAEKKQLSAQGFQYVGSRDMSGVLDELRRSQLALLLVLYTQKARSLAVRGFSASVSPQRQKGTFVHFGDADRSTAGAVTRGTDFVLPVSRLRWAPTSAPGQRLLYQVSAEEGDQEVTVTTPYDWMVCACTWAWPSMWTH